MSSLCLMNTRLTITITIIFPLWNMNISRRGRDIKWSNTSEAPRIFRWIPKCVFLPNWSDPFVFFMIQAEIVAFLNSSFIIYSITNYGYFGLMHLKKIYWTVFILKHIKYSFWRVQGKTVSSYPALVNMCKSHKDCIKHGCMSVTSPKGV